MRHKFRSYQLAVQFYRQARGLKLPHHLKDQFLRAASSAALNLSEGSAKTSVKDRRKFYRIALGSIQECHAVIDLASPTADHLEDLVISLGRHVYKLCKALE